MGPIASNDSASYQSNVIFNVISDLVHLDIFDGLHLEASSAVKEELTDDDDICDGALVSIICSR